MSSKLPYGSTVGEYYQVLHEGNHNNEFNPHPQYQLKSQVTSISTITGGVVAPSGGNNGDIYFQCTPTSAIMFVKINGVWENKGIDLTVVNFAVYDSISWSQWNTTASSDVRDVTGMELTQKTGGIYAKLALNLKANTKYGYLFNIISNSFPSNNNSFFIDAWENAQSADVQINNSVGNFKFIDTSPSVIANNRLSFASSSTLASGVKIKIKDVRIFELFTGSQIELDFTNLTADELNTNYPFDSQ